MEYVSFVIYAFKCLYNSYLFVNMAVSNVYAACLTLNQNFIYVFLLLFIMKSTAHQPQVLLRENELSLASE
jgi:cell shape-determining protein MreC